jgi:hypothetical protein
MNFFWIKANFPGFFKYHYNSCFVNSENTQKIVIYSLKYNTFQLIIDYVFKVIF